VLKACLGVAHSLGKTLDEIGQMDVQELATWIAYLNQYDPPAELRSYWRAGVIAATIANAHSKGGGWEPADYMPKRDRGTPPAEAQSKLLAWCANVGTVQTARR